MIIGTDFHRAGNLESPDHEWYVQEVLKTMCNSSGTKPPRHLYMVLISGIKAYREPQSLSVSELEGITSIMERVLWIEGYSMFPVSL